MSQHLHTNLHREAVLIIDLSLHPLHQQSDVLWGREGCWLFVVDTITPVVLISVGKRESMIYIEKCTSVTIMTLSLFFSSRNKCKIHHTVPQGPLFFQLKKNIKNSIALMGEKHLRTIGHSPCHG